MTLRTAQEQDENAGLLARIAQGDQGAFARFYRNFSGALYGLALRMVSDPKDCEDILQECFTTIWAKAGSYDPARGSAYTWAALILRHKAIDRLRVRRRAERIADRAANAPEFAVGADTESSEAPAMRERRELIRKALAQMPEDQKAAIELAFFKGLTHEQISEQLGEPLGTIKARIRRGLLRMRDHVKETRS